MVSPDCVTTTLFLIDVKYTMYLRETLHCQRNSFKMMMLYKNYVTINSLLKMACLHNCMICIN